MEILYSDDRVLVCVKPVGVVSVDEAGGLPELLRLQLGDPGANLRTVHRLDRVVGGLMVLARTARAASDLSAQIRGGSFEKEYLAVCRGCVPERGAFSDLLLRDRAARKTVIAEDASAGAKPARLSFRTLARADGFSLVRVRLETGRTHQIRAQFSGRGFPLAGDRKYGAEDAFPAPALWSCRLRFFHPRSGEPMTFFRVPPPEEAWAPFAQTLAAMTERD